MHYFYNSFKMKSSRNLFNSLLVTLILSGCVIKDAALPPCSEESDRATFPWLNCYGTQTSPNGSKYIGEYRKNKKDGQGTLVYDNGSKYVGKWRNNKKNGQGTYEFLNGDKYIGSFKHGKFQGMGTYNFS
jgi:hypothetical protein